MKIQSDRHQGRSISKEVGGAMKSMHFVETMLTLF